MRVPKTYLNAQAVHEITGVTPDNLKYHRTNRNITGVKIDNQWCYELDAVNRLLKEYRLNSNDSQAITIQKIKG